MANNNLNNSNSSFTDDQYYQQQQYQQLPLEYQNESEDIVQVVYQSNQNGSLIGVESSFLTNNSSSTTSNLNNSVVNNDNNNNEIIENNLTNSSSIGVIAVGQLRSTSTLPSVAEESTSGINGAGAASEIENSYYLQNYDLLSGSAGDAFADDCNDELGTGSSRFNANSPSLEDRISNSTTINYETDEQQQFDHDNTIQEQQNYSDVAIYSTINKNQKVNSTEYNNNNQQYQQISNNNPISLEDESNSSTTTFYTAQNSSYSNQQQKDQSLTSNINADNVVHHHHHQQQQQQTDSANTSSGTLQNKHSPIKELLEEDDQEVEIEKKKGENLIELVESIDDNNNNNNNQSIDEKENNEEEFHKLLTRSKGGAAESGSFRHNFRKKLGVSVSTNENDLIAHRQKLLEVQEASGKFDHLSGEKKSNHLDCDENNEELANLPTSSKFKRIHSVSFNVGSNRSGRHSVDIRNLPSYLTIKRASIVDVAKGAMSSLMHSLGASSGGGSSIGSGSHRRDSSLFDETINNNNNDYDDDEPIFEEPIAPTLSLGQRVALVKNSGAEFGTVGWIGQLPDVDDDWIVGVIFDNMIGNCDGEYNGNRYFYARENYAMFVPLSSLTKTDNYIGRPETGTMLSRMSVSLKPGQLISIQRSSIRLQHCFLNAPHQRVGHDVRAVSNRLHCQCHNCGPCAHLTKQGRIAATPLFGAHHAPNKKNSLAHAAVEILAHHHHHYHEEEHHEEDYQFGDNAAHACNFVRYSCCQQAGSDGHNFSADCQMVRPELLDNLIHAPKAPHRRSRPRRSKLNKRSFNLINQQNNNLLNNQIDAANNQIKDFTSMINSADYNQQLTIKSTSSIGKSDNDESSYTSCSSSVSGSSSRSSSPDNLNKNNNNNNTFNQMANYCQYNNNNYNIQAINNNVAFSAIDQTQMSILDQQRLIFRKESSTIRSRNTNDVSDDYYNPSSGLGSTIRRCFACLIKNKKVNSNRRPKKRKLSARNRLIEYHRRQSTFVPSTLAKPQEDFASHGIILPNSNSSVVENHINQLNNPNLESNSDYSSYSKSSSSSSLTQSSDNNNYNANQNLTYEENLAYPQEQIVIAETYQNNDNNNNEQQQQSITLEQEFNQGLNEHQLKDCSNNKNFNYDDYTFSDGSSSTTIKKDFSNKVLTYSDLGYYDSLVSNSNDTLKQIVDQAINDEEPLINELEQHHNGIVDFQLISPISSSLEASDNNDDQNLNISSPTASNIEQDEDEFDENQEEVLEKINNLSVEDKKG